MTRTRSSRAVARVKTDDRMEAEPAAPAHQKMKPAKAEPSSVLVLQPDAALQLDARKSPPPRGIKQRLVLDLLQRDGGATLGELTDATNWLPHTVRAALTRLRQGGHHVVRSRREDGASVYTCTDRTPGDTAQVS